MSKVVRAVLSGAVGGSTAALVAPSSWALLQFVVNPGWYADLRPDDKVPALLSLVGIVGIMGLYVGTLIGALIGGPLLILESRVGIKRWVLPLAGAVAGVGAELTVLPRSASPLLLASHGALVGAICAWAARQVFYWRRSALTICSSGR